MSQEGQCLRCDATLTPTEIDHGGRWKEFCRDCRVVLQRIWPTNRPSQYGACPTCGHDPETICYRCTALQSKRREQ